ncbi:hypothetical protein GJ496_001047 [Pomphorhynchus laevis]|nr:hypothetical protein GJ496_001047 [Pomphorhynchus laevis]
MCIWYLIREYGSKFGYIINERNCNILVHSSVGAIAKARFKDQDLNVVDDGLVILGSSEGTKEFINKHSRKEHRSGARFLID